MQYRFAIDFWATTCGIVLQTILEPCIDRITLVWNHVNNNVFPLFKILLDGTLRFLLTNKGHLAVLVRGNIDSDINSRD